MGFMQMRTVLRKHALSFVYRTAAINVFWPFYKTCDLVSRALASLYRRAEYGRNTHGMIARHFSELTVKNGIFKGMRYPSADAVGSVLLPKLLGSYEKELEDVFAEILHKDYGAIVDVGCAEGYYAVGLALRFPKARVYAFDTNKYAQKLCHEMARLNGVDGRLAIGGLLDESALLALPLSGPALIITDCEGYEKQLFTPRVVAALARHDVLIEVHDLFDMEISAVLRERFKDTHNLRVIESSDVPKKVRTYRFPELEPYDAGVRFSILGEGRGGSMEWFYFTPKV